MSFFNYIEESEDEPVEFDRRYNIGFPKKTKKFPERRYPTKGRMAYFSSLDRYGELLEEKKRGKKIIGYFCNMVPEELVYAAGAIPLRLCSGCIESVHEAEEFFPRDICPLIKSSAGLAIADQGFISLCDAIVIPASCDGKKKLGEILDEYRPVWMMDLPQVKEKTNSKKYWLSEVRVLKSRLERLTGKVISKASLKEAILLIDSREKRLRDFAGLRKKGLISGRDSLVFLQSSFTDDINRWLVEAGKLIQETKKAKPIDLPRVLVTGSPMIYPNFKIPDLIEGHGALLIDDTCAGSGISYNPVVVDEWNLPGMLRAVAERSLMPSVCPCFMKSEDRIDRILDMVKGYEIDGIIYHVLRLCVLFDMEALKIQGVAKKEKLPFLKIATDYSKEDEGQLSTRIEAFIEILRSRR